MPQFRKIAYATGAVLSLASLVFVAWALSSQFQRVNLVELPKLQPGPLALSALLYAASLLTTALAWPILVNVPRQTLIRLVTVGLASQVAKYIPGNVANYLGRGLIAQRYSVGIKRSVTTTVVEIASSIIAGMVVGLVCISNSNEATNFLTHNSLQLQLLMASILLAFFLFARGEKSLVTLIGATVAFMVSFIFAGASFYTLGLFLAEGRSLEPTFAIASFAFAWIAGFVVAGAPAGIGIREAVLVALLTPSLGLQLAALAAAVHRLITIGVDLAMGLVANYLLWRQAERHHD